MSDPVRIQICETADHKGRVYYVAHLYQGDRYLTNLQARTETKVQRRARRKAEGWLRYQKRDKSRRQSTISEFVVNLTAPEKPA